MDTTNFTDLEGPTVKTSAMVDEHQIIRITEKTPDIPQIGRIVRGDTNSAMLTFEISRYYDGVDLCTKEIKFIVKNEYGVFTESAVNPQYNDTFLRFSWVLSYAATTGDTGFVTMQDVADAISGMEYESVPIDFSEAF